MYIEPIKIHFLLGIFSFFLINWLGKHSSSLGYISLSAFVKRDEAPAFNLFFRILSPVILLILYASFLYSVGLDQYVINIWVVTAFYCGCRLLFILLFDRIPLVNWSREILIWTLSTSVSWWLYEHFISSRSNLLPNAEELKNEFWILVILFIYSIFNQLEFSEKNTLKRKLNYLNKSFLDNKKKYHSIIKDKSVDALSESMIYAVLIHEGFNRPYPIRLLEKITFPHFAKSLGPMQITTDCSITDDECVAIGADRIVKSYLRAIKDAKEYLKDKEFNPYTDSGHLSFLQYRVGSDYNKDDKYVADVQEMHNFIIDNIYTSFKQPVRSFNRIQYFLDSY